MASPAQRPEPGQRWKIVKTAGVNTVLGPKTGARFVVDAQSADRLAEALNETKLDLVRLATLLKLGSGEDAWKVIERADTALSVYQGETEGAEG